MRKDEVQLIGSNINTIEMALHIYYCDPGSTAWLSRVYIRRTAYTPTQKSSPNGSCETYIIADIKENKTDKNMNKRYKII